MSDITLKLLLCKVKNIFICPQSCDYSSADSCLHKNFMKIFNVLYY